MSYTTILHNTYETVSESFSSAYEKLKENDFENQINSVEVSLEKLVPPLFKEMFPYAPLVTGALNGLFIPMVLNSNQSLKKKITALALSALMVGIICGKDRDSLLIFSQTFLVSGVVSTLYLNLCGNQFAELTLEKI